MSLPTIQQLEKIAWQYIVNRREALLLRSITDSSNPSFKRITGLGIPRQYSLRTSTGPYFRPESEFKVLRRKFELGGLRVIKNFRNRLVQYLTQLDDISDKLSRVHPEGLNQKELYRQLNLFLRAVLRATNFLDSVAIADKILSEMLVKSLPDAPAATKQQWLYDLTFPSQEDVYLQEQRDFYRLASMRHKSAYTKNLKRHLQMYAWIGTRGWWFNEAWSQGGLDERVRALLAKSSNPRKDLVEVQRSRRHILEQAAKLRRKLKIKLSSSTAKLAKLCAEFAYLRVWRSAIIYRAGWRVEELLAEPLRRIGWPADYLPYVSWHELLHIAKATRAVVTAQELVQRRKFNATLWWRTRLYILSGRQWEKAVTTKIIGRNIKKTSEVRGVTAFRGKVTGRAVLVLSTKDLWAVKRGDIMVAVMTFPQFVPAMEKAAAFVTDEGGILCHAAIVSREMKKPCIIGTKMATKLFKTGDLIEVDAHSGVVRRIK